MITNKTVRVIKNKSELKRNLIDFSSRYQRSDLIYYSDFDILTFETYDRIYNPNDPRQKEPDGIKYYQITKGTQYKPWLASDDVYGDPGYWWLLMEFNNIFDVEEFTAGKTLKVPPVTIAAA